MLRHKGLLGALLLVGVLIAISLFFVVSADHSQGPAQPTGIDKPEGTLNQEGTLSQRDAAIEEQPEGRLEVASATSSAGTVLAASHQAHDPVTQRREKIDLFGPQALRGAREYASSAEFNPTKKALNASALQELTELIEVANKQLAELKNKRIDAVTREKEARLAAGHFMVVSEKHRTPVESGTIPIWCSQADSPGEKYIVCRYGESAELDVVTDDMWAIVESTQLQIKQFIGGQ